VKPEGARVTLRAFVWEGPLPEPGDFLRTNTGRCYRIDEQRLAKRDGVLRGPLHCTVLPRDAVQFGDPGVSRWTWGRRERQR
jgi:hypothetical protein